MTEGRDQLIVIRSSRIDYQVKMLPCSDSTMKGVRTHIHARPEGADSGVLIFLSFLSLSPRSFRSLSLSFSLSAGRAGGADGISGVWALVPRLLRAGLDDSGQEGDVPLLRGEGVSLLTRW